MFLTYFIAVFLTLLHISAGNSQPCPYPQRDSQYIVVPQYNPTSGSIFSNDPGVTIFTNVFLQCVYNSPLLRELFYLRDTTALQYSEFNYKYIQYALNYYGVPNAEALAEFSTRGIASNFDVLTMPLMARIKGNTCANFLFVEGILTVDNAENLAKAYAETFEKNAFGAMTGDPTSKFQVLIESFVNFILSVDDNAIPMAHLIAYYYGNEWFVAALNYRWVNYY